jgi:hypothetical protein
MTPAMRLPFLLALPLALIAPAAAIPQTPGDGYFEALRAVDQRLATIGYRLATGNAALCRDLQPVPGLVLHAVDQYDADARGTVTRVFGFAAPVAVEAVVDGAPAARAGLAQNDAVVAIGGRSLPAPTTGSPTSVTRDAAAAILADQPAAQPVTWTILRGGARREIAVPASSGCRAAFEVLLGRAMAASSDGRIVQIGVRFFERYRDDEVAAVVAHELAHSVLRHRIRLEAAGVSWGVLAEFGKNRRLFRQTEEDADRLSVHLLRNAGYDPASAPAFWRDHGGDVDSGLFRGRTHPSSKARAAAMTAEIATIPADAPRPYLPPVLATRDQPLG